MPTFHVAKRIRSYDDWASAHPDAAAIVGMSARCGLGESPETWSEEGHTCCVSCPEHWEQLAREGVIQAVYRGSYWAIVPAGLVQWPDYLRR